MGTEKKNPNGSVGLSRRQFMVHTAAGVAGAAMSMYGFAWGDLAYGQQLKGKPVNFGVAVRPDWTQGWSGMINQEKGFWKKYLPLGSQVTFTHPIQGGIVTSELIANKVQIGYNGDAPGIIATFQRKRADIRIIGLVGSSPTGYACYEVLTRPDAPKFKSSKEAIHWMDGKVLACPRGSCTDRFFLEILQREGVKPAAYLNQPIGVITTNLRLGKIDGAATWDPQGAVVSTIAGKGYARVVSTGYPWHERDSGTIVARKDFMDQHPDIVKAWLKSEAEAQMWYYDPRNHAEVLHIADKYIKGFTKKALWFSMCGLIPAPYYGGAIRDTKPFVMNKEIAELHKKIAKYLYDIKVVPGPKLLPGAHDDTLARDVLKELHLTPPIARVKAVPIGEGYPLFLDPNKIKAYENLFKFNA